VKLAFGEEGKKTKATKVKSCVFPFSNAAHKLAFEPNRLNAGIKVAFRESMKAAFQGGERE